MSCLQMKMPVYQRSLEIHPLHCGQQNLHSFIHLVEKSLEQSEPSYIADGNVKGCSCLREQDGSFLKG